MRGIHVYVHVPFCVDPCGYCDFYRGPHRKEGERTFRDALRTELNLRLPRGARLSSVYFGGGTPSLLTAETWRTAFTELTGACGLSDETEISIEANPVSVTPENARVWKDLGINRVSVGVQSLNDRILRFLNRLHTSADAVGAVETLERTGFENVSADLIYGIPGQALEDLRDAVRKLAPDLQHLSAYSLTIEPGTPFERRGVRSIPGDDAAQQYEILVETAESLGLARYEISNFARTRRECMHNLNTWRYGSYIGLGPSAVGFDGRRRYKNVPDLKQYADLLRRGDLPESFDETVDEMAALKERLLVGLRTREGAALSGAERRDLRAAVESLGLAEHFEWPRDKVRLRESSMILMDEILARMPDAILIPAGLS